MNAKISVTCYKSKVLSNGECPLMVKITKSGKRSLKTLGVSVNPRYWDFEKERPKSNCPNRTYIVNIITNALQKYQAIQLDKETKCEEYTASEILTKTELKSIEQISVDNFMTTLIRQLRENGKIGNSNAYQNLRSTLHNFHGKKLNFYFGAIDVAFCNKFEAWMRKNQFEDTTMSYYFRTLRATYNKAVEAKCAVREKSPFIEYKLSRFCTKTMKRALTKENVKKILELDCSNMSEKACLAHDVFAFSYYCGGISLVDISNLTPENIMEGRLVYERQKTHGIINLTILDEAQFFIDKYKTYQEQAGYLFPILDNRKHVTPMQKYNRVRKLCSQINSELHKIAEKLGIKEDVTTYVARHSFATILKKSGVNIGIISQALGHQDIKTTQIYLDSFDNEQIDEAMKNLL